MALHLAGMAALVKSFLPSFAPPQARNGLSDPAVAQAPAVEHIAAAHAPAPYLVSAETEAALAPLDLPPDGPIDSTSVLRARLAPEVAARNFVRWTRALDLVGCYSKRSISALYREFSEVDQRTPVGDTQFFEALEHIEGVRKEQLCLISGKTKFRRAWQWIIEPAPAQLIPGDSTAAPDEPEPPMEAPPAAETVRAEAQEPQMPLPVPKPMRQVPLLTRFVLDDHPFSPAGLREHAKHARRARLNAAASRKQRGAVRRAN